MYMGMLHCDDKIAASQGSVEKVELLLKFKANVEMGSAYIFHNE